MSDINKYLRFCKIFHGYSLPKLKFKELSERYKLLYRNVYNIDEEDINKASFIVFSFFFCIMTTISFFFTIINILFIIFYSLVISLIITYRFNITLYKRIKKEESTINALLYLIKINFSLKEKTLKSNSDYSLAFINLIKSYNIPISENFKIILRKIHEGYAPKEMLLEMVSPSEDLNQYIREMLVNNFNTNYYPNYIKEGSLEKSFRIILRDIEAKISIIFFVGLFFPIGLCFLILFHQINSVFLILFIPLFFVLLNLLHRKFVKIDFLLIGLLNEYSRNEKKKFDEFLLFLKSFALNLKSKISPEKAFIEAYYFNKNHFKFLNDIINTQVSHLLNLSYPFGEMLNILKVELKSIRYNLILDTIESMLTENSYYSSSKILEILDIISKHRRLEEKLNIIIKGEKFKVLFFIFLLPVIIGAIGGMLPLFIVITNNLEGSSNFSYDSYFQLKNIIDLSLIFLTLFLCNLITCYYFLKIINYEKIYLIIVISSVIFVLSFFMSFTNLIILF